MCTGTPWWRLELEEGADDDDDDDDDDTDASSDTSDSGSEAPSEDEAVEQAPGEPAARGYTLDCLATFVAKTVSLCLPALSERHQAFWSKLLGVAEIGARRFDGFGRWDAEDVSLAILLDSAGVPYVSQATD